MTVVKIARPPVERHELSALITVAALCDQYVVEAELWLKASTLQKYRGLIKRHVKPLLGSRTVRSLTSDDLEGMFRDIAGGKTVRDRTNPRRRNGGR
jgi:Phage integrase, N-terminal SAM-like domain